MECINWAGLTLIEEIRTFDGLKEIIKNAITLISVNLCYLSIDCTHFSPKNLRMEQIPGRQNFPIEFLWCFHKYSVNFFLFQLNFEQTN